MHSFLEAKSCRVAEAGGKPWVPLDSVLRDVTKDDSGEWAAPDLVSVLSGGGQRIENLVRIRNNL